MMTWDKQFNVPIFSCTRKLPPFSQRILKVMVTLLLGMQEKAVKKFS